MIQKKSAGFTLIELIITVAIAGILVTVAIPSFNSTISSNRLTNSANDLVGALNLARSEAVKRGMQVTLSNGTANSDWGSAGWTVFTDANGDGVLNGTDLLLKTYPPITNGYTLMSGGNYTCWVAYNAVGLSIGSGVACGGGLGNDTFRLCYGRDLTTSLIVVINTVGRARISPASSGSNPTCP